MSDTSLSQLRALFDEVCDLPAQQRERVLEARGLPTEVRQSLDKLLASHDSVGEFMEKPAGEVPLDLHEDFGRVMSERDAKGSRSGREHDPLVGFTLGGYRITRVLGEGGMGVVYEAQQEQPSRTVALKVMRWSLPSERLRKRFAHEAQALGRLQHPGIAQIFEAGSAPGPDGRALPFFAMEFVAGTPLLEYARVQGLDAREKAELMAGVAEAVQHAHQKGVIHRDLKPANILVENEGSRGGTRASGTAGGPRPRVLDFGIARLTEPQSEGTVGTGDGQGARAAGGFGAPSGASLVTDTGQLLGTVAYMSPEQVRGDAGAIDTRSDVYAMGVVLFELLTGQLPYDVRNKPITQAAAVIAGTEAKFDRGRDGAIASELQTIVLKALEKEPERRYASAGDLAADLRRYLEDLPISARPPTTLYHVRKFAKRNRALVAGLAAAFLMLVLGVVGTSMGLVRAREAQRLSETRLVDAKLAAKTAESSEAFLMSILTAANPVVAKNRELTVRELLDEAAVRLDTELSSEQAVALRSRLALAKTYVSIAAYDQADAQISKADAYAIEHFGEGSVEHSLVMAQRCELYQSRSMIADALPLARKCLDTRLAKLPADDVLVGRAEYALGRLLANSAKFAEGAAHLRRAVAIVEPHSGTDPILYATELASVLRRTRVVADREEAIGILEANLKRAQGMGGQGFLLASHVLMNLSEISAIRNDFPRMVEQLTEAVTLRESVYPKEHPHVLYAKMSLARAKRLAEDYAGSREMADSIIEPVQRVLGKDAPMLRDIYEEYARCCIDEGNLDCAKEKSLEATALLNEKTPFVFQITTLTTLVEVCLARKDFDEAVEYCDRMLAMAKQRNVSSITMHVSYVYRIRGLMGLARLDEALRGVDEVLAGLPDVEQTLDARLETRTLKAEVLSALKRYDESHAVFADIIKTLEPTDPAWAAEVLEKLAQSLDAAGEQSRAAESRARAAELIKASAFAK